MKQLEIINKLNQLDVFGQLSETTNIYEHYDCYNDNYLIEIKSRQREYNPWLIEKYKYDITDLTINGYNFNWETRQQPETTEFYLQDPIPKRVGYLLEQFGKMLT
jgi:hypothetical protein